jgi:DNA-binding CsgD family transcriptional regulator
MAPHIRIGRGALDAAATALSRWRARGLPEQFGLPAVAHAEAALAEAQGRVDDALAHAGRAWAAALDTGRLFWALMAGVDTARIAWRRATARWPPASAPRPPPSRPIRPTPTRRWPTSSGPAERDSDRAKAAAIGFKIRGNVVGELAAWEEVAVAAAARDDGVRAREHAGSATALAESLGATAVTRRLGARLRDLRVRVGPPRRQARPARGRGGLTPTELQVAELVGQGLTSPQIATRLFLSPRTVQTHVSHCLRKLDLRTRARARGDGGSPATLTASREPSAIRTKAAIGRCSSQSPQLNASVFVDRMDKPRQK